MINKILVQLTKIMTYAGLGFLLGVVVAVTCGCAPTLTYVEPQPRHQIMQALSNVEVQVYCGSTIITSGNKSGNGVVISERHVLTAQHVVACPIIPKVKVVYHTGDGPKILRMSVTEENEVQDIAKLEIMSLETFKHKIPPPVLWTDLEPPTNEYACMWPSRPSAWGSVCGVVDMDPTKILGMDTKPGDSGAGVYTQGLDTIKEEYTDKDGVLIGLVIRKGEGYARIAPIGREWLNP